jgi:chitin disaccharide deacetylase
MGTAISTPELRAIVERIAAKYKVGISRYFGEEYKTMFDVPVELKKESLMKHLDNLKPGKVNLVVLHLAQAHPEMTALFDMNNIAMSNSEGVSMVSKHRKEELDMITSKEFLELVRNKKIRLITYRDVIKSEGLKSMKWKEQNY